MRYIGCHVSCSGGLQNGIKNGKILDVNTIQLHPSPPQRWVPKPFDSKIAENFLTAKNLSPVKKVFFHGIYLINLSSESKQIFHLSKISLVYYLQLCDQIQGDGVIFHVGSFKNMDEAKGFEQVIYGINWILDHAEGNKSLILEVSAGAGNIIGDRLEELLTIYQGIEKKDRVYFALDTQHLYASGYDVKNNCDEVITEVNQVLGIHKIKAIHLNDSKTELGSKKDRHENLGQGFIGKEALRYFVNNPLLKNIPMILETPILKDQGTASNEVQLLKSWIKE